MATRKILTMLLIVLFLGAASAATAEATMVAKNFTARIGIYHPTSKDTRDFLGSSWLDVGVGYRTSATETAEQVVDVGYVRASGKTVEDVKYRFHMIPLRYTYLTKPDTESKLYYGVGAGAYFARYKAGDLSKDKTMVGMHVLGGVKLSEVANAEIGYTHMFTKLEELKISGLMLSVNGRF